MDEQQIKALVHGLMQPLYDTLESSIFEYTKKLMNNFPDKIPLEQRLDMVKKGLETMSSNITSKLKMPDNLDQILKEQNYGFKK